MTTEQPKISVKITSGLLAAVIGAGVAFGAAAQGKEPPGEMVELKSLRFCPTNN